MKHKHTLPVVVSIGLFVAVLVGLSFVQVSKGLFAANTHSERAGVKESGTHEHPEPKEKAAKPRDTKENAPPSDDHAHGGPETGEAARGADDHADEQLIRLNADAMKQFGIEVATARSGELENSLSLPGEVVLNEDRKAHIVPRVAGVVKEVRKTLGDKVKQGEVLAVIESRELADARAEYLAAQEKVSLAQAKHSREERLWKRKISSEQEYLDTRQELAEARIALRSAEQKLYALGLSHDQLKPVPQHANASLTRFEIVAPFHATVIEKHITLGEMLKDDADCFVIADLGTVWINLNVYQKDLPRVREGQRVLISLGQEGGSATEGRIAYIEPVVKEETRTALARVILPNPHGEWRPGMFVTARVAVESSTAPIVIPQSALQTLDAQQVVFVQTEEGFEPRPVTVGRTTNGSIEITSGLASGERVAIQGTFTLKAQLSKGAFGDGHNH